MFDFKWDKFLDLAKHLLYTYTNPLQDLSEAALRTVVSRAYFAAFLIARDFVIQNNVQIDKKAVDHVNVKNYFIMEAPSIYSKLDDMRKWRNKCDYDIKVDNLPLMAKTAITNAEEIIKALKS